MAKKGKHSSKNSSKQEQDKELLSAEGGEEFAVDSLPPEIKEAIGKIETLPPEQRKTICRMYSMRYEAPLPPPDLLNGYEQVLPGAAERIFAMTEQEALHRRAMERRVITLDGTAQLTGLVSALVVALAALVVVSGPYWKDMLWLAHSLVAELWQAWSGLLSMARTTGGQRLPPYNPRIKRSRKNSRSRMATARATATVELVHPR